MSSKASSFHSNFSSEPSEIQSLLRQCGEMDICALAAQIYETHAATAVVSAPRTSSCAKSATRALQELEKRNRVDGKQRTRVRNSKRGDGGATVQARINATHGRKGINQRFEYIVPEHASRSTYFSRLSLS